LSLVLSLSSLASVLAFLFHSQRYQWNSWAEDFGGNSELFILTEDNSSWWQLLIILGEQKCYSSPHPRWHRTFSGPILLPFLIVKSWCIWSVNGYSPSTQMLLG
jgi:hypothetical protein